MTERTEFEGHEVDGYQLMFRQYRGPIDVPLVNEETVHLKVTAKVTDVGHRTNQRNGLFIRHHELKIVDVEVELDT